MRGIQLAQAGAASSRQHASDPDGDESPAESGDESPHSTVTARGHLRPPKTQFRLLTPAATVHPRRKNFGSHSKKPSG